MARHRSFSCLAALLLLVAPLARAHTWVEELSVIGSNGTFVGAPGYPRGFIQRSAPTFADFNLINQIPPNGRPTGNAILPTDLMCRESQFIGNQTAGNPRLSAAPGDHVALVYAENGHVTLLQNSPTKPVGSGTVFIYGTKQPSNSDSYLGIHRVWNTAGTGGDKRGKLLATRPFDDGRCFQDNFTPLAVSRRKEFDHTNNEVKCQSDVQLPQDAGTTGLYTLYYVWEWPTLSSTGAVTTNESYTTCMDINMIAKSQVKAAVINFDTNQPIDSAGIQSQLSSQYLVNPTQPPQLTTTAVVASAKSSGAAQSEPSRAVHSVSSSNPASGFVTVTVTAPGTIVTVTNTVEVIAASAQPKPHTIISIPPTTNAYPEGSARATSLTSSSSSKASSSSSSFPSARPSQPTSTSSLLSQTFQPTALPQEASQTTTSIPSTTTSTQTVTTHQRITTTSIPTFSLIPSAAATSDCPDMTTSETASTTGTDAASTATGIAVESAGGHLNSTLNSARGGKDRRGRVYVLRGRRVGG